jgi:hypothetical protein
MNEKQNPLKNKSFQFALKIVKLYLFYLNKKENML